MIYPTVNEICAALVIGCAASLLAFGIFLLIDFVRRKIYEYKFDRVQRKIEEEFKAHFDEIKK